MREHGGCAARADVKSSKESMDRMLGDIAEQENRVRGVQQSIDESLGRMAEIDHELTTVREELTANSNMVEGCRMKLGGREQRRPAQR